MRSDPTLKEPGPPPTPSWDNQTLRARIEVPPAPRQGLAELHAIARQRADVPERSKRSGGKHRRRRKGKVPSGRTKTGGFA
jgi:hypothetical protein